VHRFDLTLGGGTRLDPDQLAVQARLLDAMVHRHQARRAFGMARARFVLGVSGMRDEQQCHLP
jgi:hypothetical protein